MSELKLFMVLLGGKPEGRHIEQHDIFFGIAKSLTELIPAFEQFWPTVKIHIDSWREINQVNGYNVEIIPKIESRSSVAQLYFINLGGYKTGDMEEFHYKMVIAAEEKSQAIQSSMKTAFYLHCGSPHIDDKYGIDVDDIYAIEDILPSEMKKAYSILLNPTNEIQEDELHIGYIKLDKLINSNA